MQSFLPALLLVGAMQPGASFVLQANTVRTPVYKRATSSMQFGTGNYDETGTKKTPFSPIAGSSSEYEYGKYEFPETFGKKVDPRFRLIGLAAVLAPIPLFPVAFIVKTNGLAPKSPFKFLDRFYPPAIDANKLAAERDAKIAAAEAAAKAKKKAEQDKADADAKAAAAAAAKAAATAKAK